MHQTQQLSSNSASKHYTRDRHLPFLNPTAASRSLDRAPVSEHHRGRPRKNQRSSQSRSEPYSHRRGVWVSSLSTTLGGVGNDHSGNGGKILHGQHIPTARGGQGRKFALWYPLRTKGAGSVANKLLDLLMIFGIPRSILIDPGTEFTAEVVQHLCRWLKVPINFGPIDYVRAQGAVERLGGWIHEALSHLRKSWPKRWDEYVQPALWLQRRTPLPRIPGSPTPFELLFGRDVRSQIGAVTPELDGSDFLQHGGLHNFVADRKEAWREVTKVRDALLKRHEIRPRQCSPRNAGIQRASDGTKAKKGDLVMVQEADSTLWLEGVHRKLVHKKWTGPWKISALVTPGL